MISFSTFGGSGKRCCGDFLRRGIFQKVVVVDTVCVVVVVKAICSPELAVDREDSESLGAGIDNVFPWSSYGGGLFMEDSGVLVPCRSGSSKVTLLIRIGLFEWLAPSRILEKEVREVGAVDGGIGCELSADLVRK